MRRLIATNEPELPVDPTATRVHTVVLTINEVGPRLWEELHTKKDATEDWLLNDWLPRVPRYCGCQTKAEYILASNPAKYGSEWFRWSVDFHNRVNSQLGKPTMSYAEACERWGKQLDSPECDRCGLCCRELSVEFSEADRKANLLLPILKPQGEACVMQSDSGECKCHETKPGVCRRFEAGNWLCNMLRVNAGLEPL